MRERILISLMLALVLARRINNTRRARLRNIFQSRMSVVENFLTNLHRAHSFMRQRALYRCRRDTDSDLSPEKIKGISPRDTRLIWIFSAPASFVSRTEKGDVRARTMKSNKRTWKSTSVRFRRFCATPYHSFLYPAIFLTSSVTPPIFCLWFS